MPCAATRAFVPMTTHWPDKGPGRSQAATRALHYSECRWNSWGAIVAEHCRSNWFTRHVSAFLAPMSHVENTGGSQPSAELQPSLLSGSNHGAVENALPQGDPG